MKRLRRWLVRIVVLAGLVAALLSLVIGLVVEKHFPEALADLDRQVEPWTLRAERFERGWWTSRVTLVAETADGDVAWRYRDRLRHGPLIRGLTTLGWIGGQGSLEGPDAAGLAGLVWRLTPGVDFEGELDLSPPGHPDGRIEFSFSERLSRMDFRVENLSYTNAETGVTDLDGSGWGSLGDARMDGRLDLSARRGFWPQAVVDGPQLTVAVEQDGDLVSLRLAVGAAHARVDQSYRDASGELLLERLHRPTLEQLLDSTAGLLSAGLPPRLRDRQLGELLLLGLPGLLQHRPRVEIQGLQMTAPQGAFSGNAAMAFVKPPPAGYLANPATLISAMALNWRTELPATLARRWLRRYLRAAGQPPEQLAGAVEEILARLRADGVLVAKGKQLASQGSLSEEVWTVNGRPMAAPGPEEPAD